MKKVLLFVFAGLLSCSAFAQQGDFSVGAKGSYITVYKDFLYGLDISYHLTDQLELSLSELINPSVTKKEEYYDPEHLGLYSTNLNIRYYLLLQESWATGPMIGGQYLYVKDKDNSIYDIKSVGFNIGWIARFNITDNLKMSGSWRYTNGKDQTSHHAFTVGVSYCFNVF